MIVPKPMGISIAFSLACLLGASGCGDDRGLVQVSGRVTLAGEPMPGPGDLTFVPIEVGDGFPMRPAKAEFGPDGAYRAQSFQPGDGLYPGTYRVLVYCWETPPTPDGPAAKSYLAGKYQSQADSGLEVKVAPAVGSIEFNIDVEK